MNVDDISEGFIAIGVIVVVLALIVFMSSTIVGMSDDTSKNVQTNAELNGTNWITVSDTIGLEETVSTSRGYALTLTGANDSYFESTDSIDVDTSDNWTVSAWATQDNITDEQQTLLSVKGEIILSYNGSTNDWNVWFYDSSSRNSYDFSVNATEELTNFTNVAVTRTDDTLTLYENATELHTENISENNIADSPDEENWDGKIEEVRVWQRALNQTEQSEHINNPIDAIPQNATGRIMFDEPYRNNQLLLYNTGSVATSNATFSQGFDGEELKRTGMFENGDYEWRDDGPQIKPTSDGEIKNAPVAYVDYRTKPLFSEYVDSVNSTIELATIVLILIPLGLVVTYLYTVRGR